MLWRLDAAHTGSYPHNFRWFWRMTGLKGHSERPTHHACKTLPTRLWPFRGHEPAAEMTSKDLSRLTPGGRTNACHLCLRRL
jgi:hypothetical protein